MSRREGQSRWCGLLALLMLTMAAGQASVPAEAQQKGGKGKGQKGPPGVFDTRIPADASSVILGRATKVSITLSLLVPRAADAMLVWGTDSKALPDTGRAVSLKVNEPLVVTIDGLPPDTRYFYEVRDAATRKRLLPASGQGTFRTARSRGAGFTFTVIADSHLDQNASPEVYLRTLANVAADAPDFHVDLGDTFMTDKHDSRDSAFKQYIAQRYYLGLISQAAPLFLVLGNHDGEGGGRRGADGDGLAVWSNTMRTRYFPNPIPDAFFSGDATKRSDGVPLQDYYAWEWGDALFIVLDPFWFSKDQRGGSDNWAKTLGREQYDWLARTLENSRATFKFVFIHNLVGGLDPQGRGGAEAAPFFEWGGKNPDGTDGFKRNRPGWPMPIHQLLVRHHVAAVFHGHDHMFIKQDLDGIVYQEVPQPGNPRGGTGSAADYGYKSGVILGSSGHLRVTINGHRATVAYIRSDTSIAHSYELTSSARR